VNQRIYHSKEVIELNCERCNSWTPTGKVCTHCLCLESDALDAEQIRLHKMNGHRTGTWVHILSDKSKVVSYLGMLALAHRYGVTIQSTELTKCGEWMIAIARAEREGMSRMSARECPLGDDYTVAIGRAERNAMRQLIPHYAIKWLEIEYGFNWHDAYRACREYVTPYRIVDISRRLYPDTRVARLRHSQWAEVFRQCRSEGLAA